MAHRPPGSPEPGGSLSPLSGKRRILILGCSGSGKSTLARKLGEATGLPVIHLDREFWQPGWVPLPRDEWHRRLTELLEQPEWIMDGHFGSSLPMRLQAADAAVYLDLPRWVCLVRVLGRVARGYGRSRPDMTEGCPERLDWSFLKWIWGFRRKVRPRILRQLEEVRERVEVVTDDRRIGRL